MFLLWTAHAASHEPQGHAIPVFKAEIPLLVAYRKASAEGITARGVRGEANAWRVSLAYEKVGREIVNG